MSEPAKTRKGTRPRSVSEELRVPRAFFDEGGYPLLSLRHVQSSHGIEAMSEKQRSEFMLKWAKRAAFTWKELTLHHRHGLGYELIPAGQFHPTAPESLKAAKYMVFRHHGNRAFAGIKINDVFYVYWLAKEYGDLYEH